MTLTGTNEFVKGTETKPAPAGPALYETGPSNTELGCWAGSCLGNHQLRLKAIKIIQFQVSFSVSFQFVTNKMTNKTKSGGKKNLHPRVQAVEARDSQVHNDGLPGCDVIGASMHNHSVDGRMDVKESRS